MQPELRDLEECVPGIDLSARLMVLDYLLEVQDGLTLQLLEALLGYLLLRTKVLGGCLLEVPLREDLAYVEVGLDRGHVLAYHSVEVVD